jgi:hypothetical protein
MMIMIFNSPAFLVDLSCTLIETADYFYTLITPMKNFILATSCFFLLIAVSSQAQEKQSKLRHLGPGLSYQSNSVYLGRKDSVDLPYLTPSILYHASSGFIAEGSASVSLYSGATVDLYQARVGYEFDLGNFNGEVSAAHEFYSDKSFSVKSAIDNTISFNGSYETKLIGITTDDALDFSSSPDIALSIGLNHHFGFNDDAFVLTPAILINGGSQNYYKDYFTKRKYGQKRKGKNGNNSQVTVSFLSPTSFRLMDYELTLPVEYSARKFRIFANPVYAVPQNAAQVKVNGKIFTEKLSPSFYTEIGIQYFLR